MLQNPGALPHGVCAPCAPRSTQRKEGREVISFFVRVFSVDQPSHIRNHYSLTLTREMKQSEADEWIEDLRHEVGLYVLIASSTV